MRQKRAKSYRKQMLVYHHNFKFREPYQVLVDDKIVCDTHKASFDLVKGLQRTLQAEVKPMITQCCIQAIYETKNQEAIDLAKTFERRRCNHPPKEAKAPLECLESVVSINGVNKHRYVVASQDPEIRSTLRKVPGVPMIFMNRSVMVMEPLSRSSDKISRDQEKLKLYKGLNDPSLAGKPPVEESKGKASQSSTMPNSSANLKRKGPKGPNPLSIKKKKSDAAPSETKTNAKRASNADSSSGTSSSRRRKRSHKSSGSRQTEQQDNTHVAATNGDHADAGAKSSN
ncbi:LAME_0D10770g1_1 [Lachancea meyersii CBS 8951]|uniref:U three protein 23 n=1 Tax=Lachancea meyersii CBS 8951 TaxID=1266667 RepID=A0A1G4JC38_9SACH|nr:LAME_0D10770g1_1 [Lachancea meyersii CBS 8951]